MGAVAKVAAEVVETVADAAEETIEALDHLNNLNGTTRGQQTIVLVAVAAAAAGTGAIVSHYVTKKVMRTKFEMMMEEELEKTREFFANREHIAVDPSEPVLDPEDMLRMAKELRGEDPSVMQALSEGENEFLTVGPQPELLKLAEEGKTAEVVRKNAFEREDAEKLWTAQNDAAIAEGKPHVIPKDEFFDAENGYEQLSYTWFEEDSVLADEREGVIGDTEGTVGDMNLTRFGWLSEDENTVYVRHPEGEVEIEITRSEGSYAREVHGFMHGDEPSEKIRGRGRVRYGED